MDKKLNIVALNIPWPANYGGVIDIYYKIKALHGCGIKIILHCFEYGRPHVAELQDLCEEVHYYRRRTGLLSNLTYLPYNVYSRRDKRLIANLLDNDGPILFEGLHSCYYLNHPQLKNRFKIFRESNIEHDYYHAIGKAERNPIKKCFFHIEAFRFKRYQKNIANAELTLTVSETDTDYLKRQFPRNKIEFMPSFHGNERITATAGQSGVLLYHGNLSVRENEKAALYLVENVFRKMTSGSCIIAGMNPSDTLKRAVARYKHITLVANPSSGSLHELIQTAQVNILITFQATGLKLKLLNSLFTGRHVVVNPMMLAGTGLDELCHIARTPEEMIEICRKLIAIPFSADIPEKRRKKLFPLFSDNCQARRLIDMINFRT
jgi:hypothetical protein